MPISPVGEQVLEYRPDPEVLSTTKFRIWHVEALLNQAADLIERCVVEMRDYRSLISAESQIDIELEAQTQEHQFDVDRQDNEKPGFFERDLQLAQEKQAYIKNSQVPFDESAAQAQKAFDIGTGSGAPTHPDYIGMNGWIHNAQALFEKRVESETRAMDRRVNDHQVRWGYYDSTYRRRILSIRTASIKRKTALRAPGEAFSYGWQAGLVRQRLERNYEDALNRALVAQLGLRRIYGYSPTAAPNEALPPAGLPLDAIVTHLAKWIRNAIEWLVAYQQLDQGFSRVVSLRSLVTAEEWDRVHQADRECSFSVELPSELFAQHDNVRLRGLGAMLVGDLALVPWSLLATVPAKAVYVRSGTPHECDQGEVPSCLLGRVERRDALRPVEICGLVSLANASPIGDTSPNNPKPDTGKWSFTVARPGVAGESFTKLHDVLLEINAVGIPLLRARGGRRR